MLHHDLVLKSDELYLAGEIATDGSGERSAGLYLRDTRHLNRFALTLNGAPLETLGKQTPGPAVGVIHLTNELLRIADGVAEHDLLPHKVAIEERIELGADVRVAVTLTNYSGRPLDLELGLALAADFRDLFDIRGATPNTRGTLLPPDIEADAIAFGYTARDERRVGTVITFDQPMTASIELAPGEAPL